MTQLSHVDCNKGYSEILAPEENVHTIFGHVMTFSGFQRSAEEKNYIARKAVSDSLNNIAKNVDSFDMEWCKLASVTVGNLTGDIRIQEGLTTFREVYAHVIREGFHLIPPHFIFELFRMWDIQIGSAIIATEPLPVGSEKSLFTIMNNRGQKVVNVVNPDKIHENMKILFRTF